MDADTVFVDLVANTTLFIIVRLFAQFGVLLGIGGEPLFEFRIVGMNLSHIVTLVKIKLGDFLCLGESCFDKNPPVFQNFSQVTT